MCDTLVIQRELARRQQADLAYRIQAALRIHIEGTDSFDLVIEQVQTIRQGTAHRE